MAPGSSRQTTSTPPGGGTTAREFFVVGASTVGSQPVNGTGLVEIYLNVVTVTGSGGTPAGIGPMLPALFRMGLLDCHSNYMPFFQYAGSRGNHPHTMALGSTSCPHSE